ncbi:hypothetical protein [Streptomyces fuscichromogenes]|uniref:Uncharacterized protein n=1 Tax=Streptomyces fuscichromogenes TaxID=1324013 RepID=A0A918CS94_9ACTN|nr:hypothetical protein [Streptomyces fuscichromogenes]GGN12277.1 hypothetical protein GCM10011578_038990 [Streptomyces fuscichromogenes]
MRALATRPRRIAIGIAVVSAAALGTVSAAAAQSSPAPGHSGGGHPGRGGASLAVSYRPTGNAPADVNAVNDDFAACMRAHGEPAVPVFHATGNAARNAAGKVTLEVQGGPDKNGATPNPKLFQKALRSCAPILKDVGITLSTDADEPPALP